MKIQVRPAFHVDPYCLLFYVDESGHEEFADPNHPVFVMGGCSIFAGSLDEVVRSPWRDLKEKHFGGADKPLHAADLREPTKEQLEALDTYFRKQAFGRFGVAMSHAIVLPSGIKPINLMPALMRRQWERLIPQFSPAPVEIAFIHEASERGNFLLEKYFGKTAVAVNGRQIPVHHRLLARKGDEAMEVADFIVHAAGGQTRRGSGAPLRKDFNAVFNSTPAWTRFETIHAAAQED